MSLSSFFREDSRRDNGTASVFLLSVRLSQIWRRPKKERGPIRCKQWHCSLHVSGIYKKRFFRAFLSSNNMEPIHTRKEQNNEQRWGTHIYDQCSPRRTEITCINY